VKINNLDTCCEKVGRTGKDYETKRRKGHEHMLRGKCSVFSFMANNRTRGFVTPGTVCGKTHEQIYGARNSLPFEAWIYSSKFHADISWKTSHLS
jgi:hypothetical protein